MACQISVQYTRNSFDTHTLIRYHSKHLPSGQVRVWSAMKHEMISKKVCLKWQNARRMFLFVIYGTMGTCVYVCVLFILQGLCAVFSQCWFPERTQTPGRTQSKRLKAEPSLEAIGHRSVRMLNKINNNDNIGNDIPLNNQSYLY